MAVQSQSVEKVSAEKAIDLAFEYFKKFMDKGKGTNRLQNILLEELELEYDGNWRVAIGFDVGRVKEDKPEINLFGQSKTVEPIREVREIYLDSNKGTFVKLV
ncbi:MAG: hypothetical protein AAF429_06090 [Pseudomonadota bacterium]